MMRKRLFAIEITSEMSHADIMRLCELLTVLAKQYKFKWSQTMNPGWVRSLADEMEKEQIKGDLSEEG